VSGWMDGGGVLIKQEESTTRDTTTTNDKTNTEPFSPSLPPALIRKRQRTLPAFLSMYLLHATRAASMASEEICSFSSDTMCTTHG